MQILEKRSSGILLHITSLPGDSPVGDLGVGARLYVDFLKDSGQKWWQILPLGPTNPAYSNSPYMVSSTNAGNPLLISPDLLLDMGFLTKKEIEAVAFSPYKVDFDIAHRFKNKILLTSWQNFKSTKQKQLLAHFQEQHPWVRDYALFMSLKHHFQKKPWHNWPEEIRFREKTALRKAGEILAEKIGYYLFEQYLFFSQWNNLRSYTQKQGIGLIGDLPIYVGTDSVDVWANQEIFELNSKTGRPFNIAGVPPDYFSKTGQRWGNPLYRWNSRKTEVKEKLFKWWEQRLSILFSLVDAIRIDHFRGFESYWSVPASHKTAENGKWRKGPGIKFFQDMEKRLGTLPIIAEDLGIITPEVEKLRDDLGYPGMKILQFAFDGNVKNSYLPHNHRPDSVVFTGTHDNDTTVGWYLDPTISQEIKKQAKLYANRENDESTSIHKDFIHMALSSVAQLTIFPMQDVLGFGSDCRMNTPGTSKDNWAWRLAPHFLTRDLSDWLRNKTAFFDRLHTTKEKNG